MSITFQTSQPFKLTDDFINKYKNVRPDWGPTGEFVYMRTYSRLVPYIRDDGIEGKRKENFYETIRRVVEGSYSIQKTHCLKNKRKWNDEKGQQSAEIMYDKMFNFKFLPPGRSLWMGGTEYVKERGSACLNNCAFT